jgi:hypothetical protein
MNRNPRAKSWLRLLGHQIAPLAAQPIVSRTYRLNSFATKARCSNGQLLFAIALTQIAPFETVISELAAFINRVTVAARVLYKRRDTVLEPCRNSANDMNEPESRHSWQ